MSSLSAPVPVAPRPLRRRAALAVGAVGALVVAPAGAALADDAPPAGVPDATQPQAPEILLPSAEPVDQVPAADPPAEDPPAEDPPAEDPPAEDPPAEDPPEGDLRDGALPPELSMDPALLSAPAQAGDVAMAPYAGLGKVEPRVVTTESPAPDLSGAEFTVTWTPPGSDLGTETFTTGEDGALDDEDGPLDQFFDQTVTVSLTTPPPGFMIVDPDPVVVPPCVVERETPPGMFDPPICPAVTVEFEVVRAYRTVQFSAVTTAGAPVAGVTVELHSPLALSGSPGGGLSAAVVPGRTLVGSAVTGTSGSGTVAAQVVPGSGYLVVPTSVPDGYYLPPAFGLDVAAVRTVAEADTPIVLTLTLVPALAATGSASAPLAGIAAGLIVSGAGFLALRRRLVLA